MENTNFLSEAELPATVADLKTLRDDLEKNQVLPNGSQFGQFLKWTNQGWVASSLPTLTGQKTITGSADPDVNTVANVGDLYLNTTSGTLYEKSSISQTDFYNQGLQGLVLSNAIYVRKGNLKGANGRDGFSIFTDLENDLVVNCQSYKENEIVISNTWNVYKRNDVPVYVPPILPEGQFPPNFEPTVDYYYTYVGNIKGANGFAEVVKDNFNSGGSSLVSGGSGAKKTTVSISSTMGSGWDSSKYVRNSLELIINNKVIVISEYETAPAGGMLFALDDYRAYFHVTTGEIYFAGNWLTSGGNYPIDAGRSFVKYLSK